VTAHAGPHGGDFQKFPRTPHLFWLGESSPRGDKVLDTETAREWLRGSAIVEEKVDGANVGFSVDDAGRVRVQNRGSFVEPGRHPQFQPLTRWLAGREEALREALGSTLILFGEWCYAKHSVAYDLLPDWFLAFDVLDRATGRFYCRARREGLVRDLGLTSVPLLAEGRFDRASLAKLLGPSRVGEGPMEGIYVRWDEGDWLARRAKIVRPGWLGANEGHWSRKPIEPNRIRGDAHG
jgi:ATP-dependent RNA circularization protein (DNA/RNA ligase family)